MDNDIPVRYNKACAVSLVFSCFMRTAQERWRDLRSLRPLRAGTDGKDPVTNVI